MSCSEKSREREEEENPVGSVHKYVEGVSRNGSIVPSTQLSIDERVLVDPKQLFIGTKIGEGAHGKVYEGRYGDQIVAIKVLNGGNTSEERASLESRFVREVVMMSRVKHENLVKFIGACKDPLMVIVSELLPGMSLRKYLLSIRPKVLDLHVALNYALDIARAMECLHANGIIHRDLKPDNLLLTANQKSLKLADFGLAREETLTEMMTAETGTYRWMAPELYSTVTLRQGEKKHYNNKVDVYSFGIVLWELLTNRMPFEGMSNLQAAYAAAFKADILLRGYAGWNSRCALQVLDEVFPKDAAVQPSLVIVYFGGNDSLDPHPSGLTAHVPLPEYLENMRKIAIHLKSLSQKTRIIFLTAPAVNEAQITEVFGNSLGRSNESCRKYSEACVQLCEELGVKVIDLWKALQQRDDWLTACFTDGIHLSCDGSKIVVKEILKVVKEADWEPNLHWRSLPIEFHEISPYIFVDPKGETAVKVSQMDHEWQIQWQ